MHHVMYISPSMLNHHEIYLKKVSNEGIPEIRPNVDIPVRVTGSVFENIIIRISASASVVAANAPQLLKKSEVVLDLADNSSPLIMR
jgi:hypothetical protein